MTAFLTAAQEARWETFAVTVEHFLDACTPDTDMHLVAALASQHADFAYTASKVARAAELILTGPIRTPIT